MKIRLSDFYFTLSPRAPGSLQLPPCSLSIVSGTWPKVNPGPRLRPCTLLRNPFPRPRPPPAFPSQASPLALQLFSPRTKLPVSGVPFSQSTPRSLANPASSVSRLYCKFDYFPLYPPLSSELSSKSFASKSTFTSESPLFHSFSSADPLSKT